MALGFVGHTNVTPSEGRRMSKRQYAAKKRRYQEEGDDVRREEREESRDDAGERREEEVEVRGDSEDEGAGLDSSGDRPADDSANDERLEDHLPPADNYEKEADDDDMSDSNADGVSDRGVPVDDEGNALGGDEDEGVPPEDYEKFLRNLHFALRHHPVLFDMLQRNARMAEEEAMLMQQMESSGGEGSFEEGEDVGGDAGVSSEDGGDVPEDGVAGVNIVPEDEGGDEGNPEDRLTPEQIDELQERLRMEQAMNGGLLEEPKPGGPKGGVGPDGQPIEEPVDRLDQPEDAGKAPVSSSGGSGGRKYFIGRAARGFLGGVAGNYIGRGIGELAFTGEGSEAMKQGAKLLGTGIGAGLGAFYSGGGSKKYASGVAGAAPMKNNQVKAGKVAGGGASPVGGPSMGSGATKFQNPGAPLTYQAAVKNLVNRLNRVESELKRKDREIESLKYVNNYGHSRLLVYQLQLQGVKALSDPEKAEKMVQYMATLDPESRVAYADEIAMYWEKDPVLAEAVSGVPSDDFVTVYQGHVEGSEPVSDQRAMPLGGMERVLQFMRTPEGKRMQREGKTFDEIKQYALNQAPLQNG